MHSDVKHVEGELNASGKRFAIIISRFNGLVTEQLYAAAEDCLLRHGAKPSDITAVRVPGSYEIGPAAAKLAERADIDAVICLGAVIRGETTHYDLVAGEAAKSIGQVALEYRKPVVFGVLTTETVEQALNRAGIKSGNKGWDCALTAIEMADLMTRL